ncbi:B-cell receptor CD22-like isoform X4 [Chelonia mydas]|uniref:B-cell receptor CD22-like isoform X4 n=1 Tax=Chelonia mydas TaxID=8469 RepID=UPI001CA89EDF|nr:B-cell receptor CD22-like isoform X4 [Chelonia mydas]
MALVLVPAFCLLSVGAYAQEWSVTLAPGPLAGGAGSCVTIPCSFTYPAGWRVWAVSWTRDGGQTVYHSDEARVHAAFKGHARYLGDLQHNCSLQVSGLRPSDQGTYCFRFYAAGGGGTDSWTSEPGQRLHVSDHECQPSLGRRMKPGPSLTCSVGANCHHRPSWYERDGVQRSPGETSGRYRETELQISPYQLNPGVALRCQVDGYRDECDSDQSQPLGTVAPNVHRIDVSWLAGKAAPRGGDGFTLRCQAAALRPIARYLWSRGDVWLPEAGQDLHVEKAAISDGGSYVCGVWVSGPGWGYLSLSARAGENAPTGVRVTAAPGTSPQAGESVTLTCSYTSSLPAPNSYTWYRGDRQLEGSRQEMVLKNITAEQAGEYRCQADNGIGQSPSPPITITVLYAPTGVRVTAAPGTSPQAGESVTLTCSYTSSLPAPNSYTWYRGGRQLEGSQQEMVLKNITAEQAGEYHCQADNGIGQSPSPPLTITVLYAPTGVRVTAAPGSSPQEGESVTLTCSYTSSLPTPNSYTWYRGGRQLEGSRQEMVLKNMTAEQAGEYRCQADNGIGQSPSPPITITVLYAPTGVRVSAAPGTSPQAGESVTLTCNYTSSLPAPNSYTWYQGGRQLEGSRQEMVLKNMTAEQAGEYRCQADNGIGQSPSPPINITVLSTPRVWAPAYILGPAVALVLLLLVGLVGVTAWRKRRSKRQGLSSDPDQPGPGETPMSERIYENTQHYGMGKPARLAPPRAPSAPTEVFPGSPDGTGQSHIYSQPMKMGRVLQSDPDEVHYSAIQLQHPTRRAEPAADLTCEYAVIKR